MYRKNTLVFQYILENIFTHVYENMTYLTCNCISYLHKVFLFTLSTFVIFIWHTPLSLFRYLDRIRIPRQVPLYTWISWRTAIQQTSLRYQDTWVLVQQLALTFWGGHCYCTQPIRYHGNSFQLPGDRIQSHRGCWSVSLQQFKMDGLVWKIPDKIYDFSGGLVERLSMQCACCALWSSTLWFGEPA